MPWVFVWLALVFGLDTITGALCLTAALIWLIWWAAAEEDA